MGCTAYVCHIPFFSLCLVSVIHFLFQSNFRKGWNSKLESYISDRYEFVLFKGFTFILKLTTVFGIVHCLVNLSALWPSSEMNITSNQYSALVPGIYELAKICCLGSSNRKNIIQLLHLFSMIKAINFHMWKASCKQHRLWSDCADAHLSHPVNIHLMNLLVNPTLNRKKGINWIFFL